MPEEVAEVVLPTLREKLTAIAKEIAYIEKRGENTHHHYNYVQAIDVTKTVRDKLHEQGIHFEAEALGAEHLQYGGTSHLTTVRLSYRFTDLATRDYAEYNWVGAGVDKGGDKGLYKAYTGALKYFFLTNFLIPMTDDPERDQLTQQSGEEEHKDDARPAAPRIPADRARLILDKAIACDLASFDAEAGPSLKPVFQALLAQHGVDKIGALNVDQAEAVEAFLTVEAAHVGTLPSEGESA